MKHNFFLLIFITITSCSSRSGLLQHKDSLAVYSLGLEQFVLESNCSTIVCTEGFANEGEIWMTDIPLELIERGEINEGQIIHLQVLWTPVAGKTPLASTSTNLAIKHIIVSEGNVGIYGGGGYCWMSGNPDDGMRLDIEDATIAIQEKSAYFNDLLTPATMSGYVNSTPNATIARQIATAAELLQ